MKRQHSYNLANIDGHTLGIMAEKGKDNQKVIKTQGIENPVREHLSKRLYNLKEAAMYLGRSTWAVREMYYHGKIPCVRDGRRMLSDIVDLDEWVARNKTQLTY